MIGRIIQLSYNDDSNRSFPNSALVTPHLLRVLRPLYYLGMRIYMESSGFGGINKFDLIVNGLFEFPKRRRLSPKRLLSLDPEKLT
jgi:hypothetical protein